MAVRKIKEYMEETDWTWMVNETFSYSCPGDSYSHDEQACRIRDIIQNNADAHHGSKLRHSTIRVAQYADSDMSRQMIRKEMESGKLFALYYGHASTNVLTHENIGIYTSDFTELGNRNLFFHFFAGCNLSIPDCGRSGMGELAVTAAPRGLIGSIASTRTVWSNQNYQLSVNFFNALFNDAKGKRTQSPTIGEVYAYMKTRNSNSNELCFLYFGDPALTLPMAMLGSDAEVKGGSQFRAGEVALVEGTVKTPDGKIDENFNGEVVVKVTRPEFRDAIVSRENNGLIETVYQYFDGSLISAVRGEVKNGHYSIRVPLVTECDNYLSTRGEDKSLGVYIGFFDKNRRVGGSSYTEIPMAQSDSKPDSDAIRDEKNPVVTAEYDPLLDVLRVEVTDDTAILPGIGAGAGTQLTIDGENVALTPDRADSKAAVCLYTALVPLGHLSEGEHTVKVKATDAAGNATPVTSRKFVKTSMARMVLTADADYAIDKLGFRLKGVPEKTPLLFTIFDKDGSEVDTMEVDSERFEWNNRTLPAGHYRASVKARGAEGARVWSNSVEFSVID